MTTDPTEEQIELEDFFNLPGAERVQIRKFNKEGKREQCEIVSLDEIEPDPSSYLRGAWGPGLFDLSLLGPKGLYIKHRRLAVAPRLDGKTREPEAAAAAAAPPPFDMVAFLMQQQTQQAELMKAFVASMRPPDPAASLVALMQALGTVQTLKPAPEDPLEKARGLISLARELPGLSGSGRKPDDDDDDGGLREWGWLSELGKRFVASMPQPGAKAAEVEDPNSVEPDDMAEFYGDLRRGLELLKTRFDFKISPSDCARMLIQEAEFSPPVSAVLRAIHDGGTVQALSVMVPRLVTPELEQWAQGVIDEVKRSGAFGAAVVDPQREDGNLADAGNNAGSGAAGEPDGGA